MTDLPYTDADLRAEAIAQHQGLTDDPEYFTVGEAMCDAKVPSSTTGETWETLLDEAGYSAAQEKIHDLISGAADVSEWAIQLGVAGLKPHPAAAWKCTTTGWEVAIQVATAPDITDAATTELLTEIQAAVEKTVHRVLGLKPA